jgi:hypothetical protein
LEASISFSSSSVEADLGVQHPQLIVGGDDQGVHLQHLHVLLDEGAIELRQKRGRLLGQAALELQGLGQRAAMVGEDPRGRIDLDGDDLFGGGVRHILDVHAALGGGHHRDAAGLTVDEEREVELAGDLRAFLDIEPPDHAPFRAGLVGHQHPVEHLFGVGADVLDGLDHPDPALGVGAEALEAALAAPACVDLGFHDPHGAAEIGCGLDRVLHGEGGEAAWNSDAELFEDGLGLVFVNVHEDGGREFA